MYRLRCCLGGTYLFSAKTTVSSKTHLSDRYGWQRSHWTISAPSSKWNRVARWGTKGGIGEKHSEKSQRAVVMLNVECSNCLQRAIGHNLQIIWPSRILISLTCSPWHNDDLEVKLGSVLQKASQSNVSNTHTIYSQFFLLLSRGLIKKWIAPTRLYLGMVSPKYCVGNRVRGPALLKPLAFISLYFVWTIDGWKSFLLYIINFIYIFTVEWPRMYRCFAIKTDFAQCSSNKCKN